ncbi:MAG: polysaccharide biosynthesis tyrosine autokinase [Actinomycetota bacterium]
MPPESYMTGRTETAEGTIDLRAYLQVFRNQKKAIALCVLGMVALASLYSFTRTPSYSSKATILVRPVGVSQTELGSQPLADLVSLDTEKEIASSTEVEAAAARVLRTDPQAIQKHTSVAFPTESTILEITYSDTDPEQAAAGAKAVAEEYLNYKRDAAEAEVSSLRENVTEQLKLLVDELSDAGSSEARDDALLEIRIAIDEFIQTGASLNTNPGQLLGAPVAPAQPSSPNHKLNIAAGLFLGLFLGIGVAFLRERTDERARTREDLEEAFAAPVLAIVPRTPGWGDKRAARLITVADPQSPSSEAYRSLRTAVLAMSARQGVKTVLVTSALAGEGKSTTAANLAVSLASTGKRVVLVSADLRRPRLHQFFGLPNSRGLSDILTADDETIRIGPRDTGIENLWVFVSGPIPERPAELLQSRRMQDFIDECRKVSDITIIDGPPMLAVADCLAIAPYVDGIVLVADSQTTPRGAIAQSRLELDRIGATVLGAVLNNFDPSKAPSSYGYQSYEMYEQPSDVKPPPGGNGSGGFGPPAKPPRSGRGARPKRR